MEQEDSGPVEGGGDVGGMDAPPWLANVNDEWSAGVARHQQQPERYEEDGYGDEGYGDEPDFEEEVGNAVADFGLDDAGLDDFRDDDQFDDEDGGDDGFLDNLVDQFGRDQWKQEALSKLDTIEQQRWEEQLDALCNEFPALNDPAVAVPVFEAMGQFGRELELPDRVALDPRFARMAYLAMQAEKMAAQERPAGNGSDVVLEMGGVADPGQPAEENEFLQMAAEGRRNPNRLDWKD